MTVRPSPPMRDFEIAAILREVAEPGSGKSQFRRPLKPQPYVARHCTVCGLGMGEWSACDAPDCGDLGPGVPIVKTLPFAIGDLLWCREAFRIVSWYEDGYIHAKYVADGAMIDSTWPQEDFHERLTWRLDKAGATTTADGYYDLSAGNFDRILNRSSTQMPRWASRLTLEVVGVKVERLQEISEDDARAEGHEPTACANVLSPKDGFPSWRSAFALMWNSRYGPGSWSANQFVAAIQFRPHLANVDDLLRQREGGR